MKCLAYSRFVYMLLGMVLVLFLDGAVYAQAAKPSRAILFVIDGLRSEAPERLGLKNIQRLAKQGTLYRKAYLVMPAHPKSGAWAEMHTASIPNPVMLSGTLLIRRQTRLVQEMFDNKAFTAHLASTRNAYRSVNRRFNFSYMDSNGDESAIDWAIAVMEKEDVAFMRIHLQATGSAGKLSASGQANLPWKNNIWGEGSPYIEKAKRADELLGKFVQSLEDMGKWEDTLLIVTADHGQADEGNHPMDNEGSWITPLIFVGAGIARGRVYEYAEHIDIIPTLCHMMGIEPPSSGPGAGTVLEEIKESNPGTAKSRRQFLREINEDLKHYYDLLESAEHRAMKDAEFRQQLDQWQAEIYSMERFSAWHKAGSLSRLIETNRRVLRNMQAALSMP
ncbi:sulfatase-like hydrolase/transferase [Acidobacteria bacterium AH-259-O06]|nr:sulfatase-like hydrolase/transferase [Acidobacteria bacterium AH-259-O06]